MSQSQTTSVYTPVGPEDTDGGYRTEGDEGGELDRTETRGEGTDP